MPFSFSSTPNIQATVMRLPRALVRDAATAVQGGFSGTDSKLAIPSESKAPEAAIGGWIPAGERVFTKGRFHKWSFAKLVWTLGN